MFHQTLFFFFFFFFIIITSTSAVDFLFNSFNATDVRLIGDAQIDSSVINLTNDLNHLTNDSIQFSFGRAFYPYRIPFKPNSSSSTTISSFSTSFVFSVLPQPNSGPSCGLAFVLSNSTDPPGVNSGQFYGIFSNSTVRSVAPLLAVKFDIGRNPELIGPDDNDVGINLNNIESTVAQPAAYFNSSGGYVPITMRNGQNIQAWIDFDGTKFEINVTIAPVGVSRPVKPLINFKDPVISNYVSTEMFVGFSASKVTWAQAQRILAWSLSDTGILREINVTNLPVFSPKSSPSSSLSTGARTGISIALGMFCILCLSMIYWFWWRRKKCEIHQEEEEDDDVEDWELEYWPHRFSYKELFEATKGFSKDELLGSGGFGKVYKGSLLNNSEVAVKCVARDSKQGLREFMAEISSIGRLQHKNLVRMRGWYRKGDELMLVYDYMPNGSLSTLIFDNPNQVLGWERRRRVIVDVAEGLNYLHYGWDQVVLHRDIKSSNILLDTELRGRLGDFGLAELYQHGKHPSTTRVVGTRGYLAPELAILVSPTAASDVYSFGVVVLEIVCGKRPIGSLSDEEPLLVDWVRELNGQGKLSEAGDERIIEEYKVEEMESLLKLGLACSHPDPQRRPTMKEVVAILIGDQDASIAPPSFLIDLERSNNAVDDWCSSLGGANEWSSSVYISPRS